jgi:pimeloyl-ACP methyl ester carboxylesterase
MPTNLKDDLNLRMKDPVLFIHGIFEMLGLLRVHASILARPVLIPTLPGYEKGVGERPPGLISLREAAHYLRNVILEAGYERVHVVGHSVGGTVGVLLTHEFPEVVLSFVNVEGNFTLKDAFWTKRLAEMSEPEAEAEMSHDRADCRAWLRKTGTKSTPEGLAIVEYGLGVETRTVQAMARSVIETTDDPQYFQWVNEILDRGTPVHLFAGERSRPGWDVPEWVIQKAASLTEQPGVGHMMVLEQPEEFLRIVAGLIQ